jgi:hypothetical protein
MSRVSIRIQEASTWKGVVYVATATAIGFFPELTKEITMGAFGVSGVIGILFSETPYSGPEVAMSPVETKPSV